MTSFATSSLRALRRFLHRESRPKPVVNPGSPIVLDGMTAVALTESMISQSAALGATYPASIAARAWRRSNTQGTSDRRMYGLSQTIECEDGRAALSGAIGLAMSGERATTFLSGPDLFAAQDVLRIAVSRHVPLIVHLACRAATSHAEAIGSDHEAYHVAGESGCVQFFAANVQEAVDFALIARRVSEMTLVPAVVAMDSEQTAVAAQDVVLPDQALINAILTPPRKELQSPTHAQRLIFGERRRNIPRWFSADRPSMIGARHEPDTFALGQAGHRVYFQNEVRSAIQQAFDEFARLTGRKYSLATHEGIAGAESVWVAQGSAIETLSAFAEYANQNLNTQIDVLGVRCTRPALLMDELRDLLGINKEVVVFDRADTPMAHDGPLLREIRSAMHRASIASGSPQQLPHIVNAIYGLGGCPLRSADLRELLNITQKEARPAVYLGLEFTRTSSEFPKHQSLLDAIRRSYPEIESLGVRGSADQSVNLCPTDSLTLALYRTAKRDGADSITGHAVQLIHGALGGHVRSRPSNRADVVTHSANPLRAPGDDSPIDVAIFESAAIDSQLPYVQRWASDAHLLLPCRVSGDKLQPLADAHVLRQILVGDRKLFGVPVIREEEEPAISAIDPRILHEECLLGGLLRIVLNRNSGEEVTAKQIRTLREQELSDAALTDEQRTARVEACIAAFESLQQIDTSQIESLASARASVDARQPRNPWFANQSDAASDVVNSLARWWDEVGIFAESGRTDKMVASPNLASGNVPALTATLRDVSPSRTQLPVLDPARCDGDPSLWMTCPDASLVPLVISARALIESGMEIADRAGRSADALRTIIGPLAKRINKIVAGSDNQPETFAEFLIPAFEQVTSKGEMPEDRRASLHEALEALVATVGDLPVARTPFFFDEPESKSPGSGELFSIIVNPDTCKCPELLGAVCGEHGIRLIEQTREALQRARRLYRLWEQFPDTASATIERAVAHENIGQLAGIMLSRHCLLAMAGGDGAEQSSGARLVLRHVLGLAEYHLQPRQQNTIERINALRQELGQHIRDSLANALPIENLDALAEGLSHLGSGEIQLSAIAKELDSAISGGRVNSEQLTSLVEVSRALADLHWHLSKGPSGLGRARSGIVLSSSTVSAWAGAFPYNPFQQPVVIDATGESAALALGLIHGQIRQVLSMVQTMRRARIELDARPERAQQIGDLASLQFSDLAAEERAMCPPMLVVGDGRTISGNGLSAITHLIESNLPIKVVLLTGAGGALDRGYGVEAMDPFPNSERFDSAFLALLSRRAFVAQSAIGEREHFARAVLEALEFEGPALLHLYAPSPQRHGIAPERIIDQSKLVVQSRAFPLFTFDPCATGVFGTGLNLSGNPSETSRWVVDENDQPITPIDWMLRERRFALHARLAEASDSDAISVAESLDLDDHDEVNQKVFATTADGQRLIVDDAMLHDARERLQFWRTLQELAGVVTPFTEQVRQMAVHDLREQHEAELAQIRSEYESRIAQLRAEFEADAVSRVTRGLMALSGYSNGAPTETTEGDPT